MSLLQVSGLGKSFGGLKAVDGITFDLHAGELLALYAQRYLVEGLSLGAVKG